MPKLKGRLLTGKELRVAAENELPVWYEELYHNPQDQHYEFKGRSVMEEASSGYYIGNSDIEPDIYKDNEEVAGEFGEGFYGVYAYGKTVYEQKKKLLVLENHHEQDIPLMLRRILKSEFGEQYDIELWCHFKESYWPANRKATIARLLTANNYACRHVFVDWCQLEIFIEVLTLFKQKEHRVNFYILHPDLYETFKKWYRYYEAYTTPDTNEYNDDYDLRKKFKQDMNERFLRVLDYHNIYELREDNYKRMQPIRSSRIKRKNYHYKNKKGKMASDSNAKPR